MLMYLYNGMRTASRSFQILLNVARERLQFVRPAPEWGSNNVTATEYCPHRCIKYHPYNYPHHVSPCHVMRSTAGDFPPCSSDCRVLQLKIYGVVMVTSAVLS
jgi:hypothetical protein